MAKLHLVIGNKNYSSWSLRPWMALTMAHIPFEETIIPLDQPQTKKHITEHSEAGFVPVLHHGKLTVWESLAILEYLAEMFPEKKLWPEGKAARAAARSVANEMHCGFAALRSACPMNLRRPRKAVAMNETVKTDVARIDALWRECRRAHGRKGRFLFGPFSNADAMFAPVVTRFDTYDIKVSGESRAYMEAVLATPAFKAWEKAAREETWIIAREEVE
ncbi:glutathione S-transferase family protein [Taklimakanibacter deserti]|uniref:glutathione S-transferase family protein n=1 Tax=Taklimakanibacter deserti TaxID=2267839 RepID=UPI000E64A909